MDILKGIGASEGVGIGQIYVKQETGSIAYVALSPEEEKISFQEALKVSITDIEGLAAHALQTIGKEQAAIFEAHLMMVSDPEYTGGILEAIGGGLDAVSATASVTALYMNMFEAMPDPYLRERAIDIADIGRRITAHLKGEKLFDPSNLRDAILVAEDLTPSDTALLSKDHVKAIITEMGGSTSHSAIIAKTLGIPAVMGVKHACTKLIHGEVAIVDGMEGLVLQQPDEETLKQYQEKQAQIIAYRETLKEYLHKHTVTLDGKTIEVSANIAKPAEAKTAMESGAEGIGLFRSEFIFMDRKDAPSEEEQFAAYKQVLQTMENKPVIIRTMDIGGDKQVPYLDMEKEENPFLGYRAVRYCLDHVDFFKTQLRALLRASIYGKLRIMVPMIAGVEEVRAVKALLADVKAELNALDIAFDSGVELGIMIEIPSAALKAHALAKEVDFFSIGTNDLTQYTLAVDRMNSNLSGLYNPMDPAVLRLVAMTIESAHKQGIWVGMCGNASGNPRLIPILLGMGLDEFSVSPVAVTEVRKAIMNSNTSELKTLADLAVMSADLSEVEAHIDAFLSK